MKYLVLLITSLMLIGQATAAPLPEPKVVKINDRVYALLGPAELPNKKNQGYQVNSTLIVGDSGAIVVDTGFTNEVGAHLAKAIAKITPKPVTHVINTHHHGDHTLGNVAFKNAEIISTEQCRDMVGKTGYDWLAIVENAAGRKFPDTKPMPATTTFKENTRTERTINGVKLTFWAPTGSHTVGDMMVYLPDDNVLIAGDILVNHVMPNFNDGNVKNWIGTLDQIQNMKVKTIIPGHGPLMTTADVAAMHKRMVDLYAGIEAGYKQGLSDSEIRKKLNLSAWKSLGHFDEQMGGDINRVYLEVEAANF